MVNGHYIHFYKNKYNKLTPILLIHLFWSPMQASVSEWNNLLCYHQTGLFQSTFLLHTLFTPAYFAIAASHCEFKPARTFTVMHV